MLIRQEKLEDINEIRELVKSAFLTADHSDGSEYLLIDKLRSSDGFVKELALVAVEEDTILGHIIFTHVMVGERKGLALAPLSVLPTAQKKGVGSALITKAHEIATEMGYDFSVVLGSELYYPKFGYTPAEKYGIKAPFTVPSENFMVVFFTDNCGEISGTVEYVEEMLG